MDRVYAEVIRRESGVACGGLHAARVVEDEGRDVLEGREELVEGMIVLDDAPAECYGLYRPSFC